MKNDKSKKSLTLKQAIELGEYDPDILADYPEWEELSPFMQLQYIKEGIDNRKQRLTKQMAELYNTLDFRLKPELKEALDNIHEHLRKLEIDREKYYLEYSRKI